MVAVEAQQPEQVLPQVRQVHKVHKVPTLMAVEESLPLAIPQAHNRTVPIQHKLAPEHAWAQQERRQYARHAPSLGEQAKSQSEAHAPRNQWAVRPDVFKESWMRVSVSKVATTEMSGDNHE